MYTACASCGSRYSQSFQRCFVSHRRPARPKASRRGRMTGLHKVAPGRVTLPYVLSCNARSISNKSEEASNLAKFNKYNKTECNSPHGKLVNCWLRTAHISLRQAFSAFEQAGHRRGAAMLISHSWRSPPKQSFPYAEESDRRHMQACAFMQASVLYDMRLPSPRRAYNN